MYDDSPPPLNQSNSKILNLYPHIDSQVVIYIISTNAYECKPIIFSTQPKIVNLNTPKFVANLLQEEINEEFIL